MALETDADRLEYFDPEFFGIVVQIGTASVNAIFDNGYAESNGIPGSRPMLTCRSADVSSVARGAAVTVPGHGNFTVISEQPDGSGISRVELEQA